MLQTSKSTLSNTWFRITFAKSGTSSQFSYKVPSLRLTAHRLALSISSVRAMFMVARSLRRQCCHTPMTSSSAYLGDGPNSRQAQQPQQPRNTNQYGIRSSSSSSSSLTLALSPSLSSSFSLSDYAFAVPTSPSPVQTLSVRDPCPSISIFLLFSYNLSSIFFPR